MSRHGILHSFSRKGNPYDNACIESFHSVMKKEDIYLHTYQDFREARRAILEYIEGWYNRKRIHSAIGYMIPQQKEEEELKRQNKLSTFCVQSIDISPSFRFHLTMDTLVVQLYTSPIPGYVWDFHPLERVHGAQTKTSAGYNARHRLTLISRLITASLIF
ncbi:integrase core domain-containing protein [Enterocloster clostridioformis]|nr:integrase core domain-containing protein [Enterocloster clostridioformis]